MGFLERAWGTILSGEGHAATQELQYNDTAQIRPLQALSASMERMGHYWAFLWLGLPNGGLDGLSPRQVLRFDDPSSWERVAGLFRQRDRRFAGHVERLREESHLRHIQERETEMTDETGPGDLSHLYAIHNQDVTPAILGKRCAEARQALGLSIADAATRCGVTEADLRRFEEDGGIGLGNALLIVRGLSHDTSFESAFRMPRFQTLDDMRSYAAQTEAR